MTTQTKELKMKLKTLALLCSSAICSAAFAGNVEIYGAVDEYVAVNATGG